MLEIEPEKSLAFWVFTTAHAMESALNEELAPLGITIRQVQILGVLAIHGQAAQNELAEALRIESSSVVRMLDRMERDGWIARAEDPADRRRKIVTPTEKADPVWEQIKVHGGRVKETALQGIPAADVEIVRNTLLRIQQNLLGESLADCPAFRRLEESVSASQA